MLEIYINKVALTNPRNYDSSKLNANKDMVTYDGEVLVNETIYTLIPSLKDNSIYLDKVEVINGELTFVGLVDIEKQWLEELGIKSVDN